MIMAQPGEYLAVVNSLANATARDGIRALLQVSWFRHCAHQACTSAFVLSPVLPQSLLPGVPGSMQLGLPELPPLSESQQEAVAYTLLGLCQQEVADGCFLPSTQTVPVQGAVAADPAANTAVQQHVLFVLLPQMLADTCWCPSEAPGLSQWAMRLVQAGMVSLLAAPVSPHPIPPGSESDQPAVDESRRQLLLDWLAHLCTLTFSTPSAADRVTTGQATACWVLTQLLQARIPLPASGASSGSGADGLQQGRPTHTSKLRQQHGRGQGINAASQPPAVEPMLQRPGLERLLEDVLNALPAWGPMIQKHALSVLVPLMAQAASQLPMEDYEAACGRLAAGLLALVAPGTGEAVGELLSQAVSLHPHFVVGCSGGGGKGQSRQLHQLLLAGVQHANSNARARAVFLLEAASAHLTVQGMGPEQWAAFTRIFKAQEEHVLHLILPVWQSSFGVLWQSCQPTSSTHPQTAGEAAAMSASREYGLQGAVQWASVVMHRAAHHSNVTMRRNAFMSFAGLPLLALAQDSVAWTAFQDAVMAMLPALDHPQLVHGEGSAPSHHSRMQDALLQSLAQLFCNCVTALGATPSNSANTTAAQCSDDHLTSAPNTAAVIASMPNLASTDSGVHSSLNSSLQTLLLQLLDTIGQACQRAASARLLLQALYNALQLHATSMPRTPTYLEPSALQSHVLPLMTRLGFLRPAAESRAAHALLLQVATICWPTQHRGSSHTGASLAQLKDSGHAFTSPAEHRGSGHVSIRPEQALALLAAGCSDASRAPAVHSPCVAAGAALPHPSPCPSAWSLPALHVQGVSAQKLLHTAGPQAVQWVGALLAPEPVGQQHSTTTATTNTTNNDAHQPGLGELRQVGIPASQHTAAVSDVVSDNVSAAVSDNVSDVTQINLITQSVSDAVSEVSSINLNTNAMPESTRITRITDAVANAVSGAVSEVTRLNLYTAAMSEATRTNTKSEFTRIDQHLRAVTHHTVQRVGPSSVPPANVAWLLSTCGLSDTAAESWHPQALGQLHQLAQLLPQLPRITQAAGVLTLQWLCTEHQAASTTSPPNTQSVTQLGSQIGVLCTGIISAGQHMASSRAAGIPQQPSEGEARLMNEAQTALAYLLAWWCTHGQGKLEAAAPLLPWVWAAVAASLEGGCLPEGGDIPTQLHQALRTMPVEACKYWAQQVWVLGSWALSLHAWPTTADASGLYASGQAEAQLERFSHMQLLPAPVGGEGGQSPVDLAEVQLACMAGLTHIIIARGLDNSAQSLKHKATVFKWAVGEFQWADSYSTTGLEALLEVTLATAPWAHLRPGPDGLLSSGVQQAEAVQAMQQVLSLAPSLLCHSGRGQLGQRGVWKLVALCFHPWLLSNRQLATQVEGRLLPLALSKAGTHVCTAVVQHLVQQVLLPGSFLLHSHLRHIVHLCVFGSFSAKAPDSTAFLATSRLDPALTLWPRVLMAEHLAGMARSGTDPAFIHATVQLLLFIVSGGSSLGGTSSVDGKGMLLGQLPSTPTAEYAWLATREAGQASLANGAKVAGWQALALLAPHLSGASARQALEVAWACMASSTQHANVRPHAQCTVLALLAHGCPEGVEALLLPAVSSYQGSKYQVVVSTVLVACFLLVHKEPSSYPLFNNLLQALLPWALHHRHAIRVPTQVLLHAVLSKHGPTLLGGQEEDVVSLVSQIQRFLTENGEVSQLRERQGLVDLESFSLDFETSLAGVYGVREVEDDSGGCGWRVHLRDRLPMDLLALVPGAVRAVGRSSRGLGVPGAVGPPEEPNGLAHEGQADMVGTEEEHELQQAPPNPLDLQPAHLQFQQLRPQVAAQAVAQAAAAGAQALAHVADQTLQGRPAAPAPGLLVVASLLNNIPNMAGLCRTCESFGCEGLVLPSKAIAQGEDFKRQAVTSERHLMLLEVAPSDVASFLRERKAQGYTIVGVEQASGSVPLQSYEWPQQAVLLLGNEQEGIPALLLPLLDVCVEIPMKGQTRSLNAHVSGALAVWEYLSQRLV